MSSTVSISLPSLMFYVPLFREFVADVLMRSGFTERFAYRTEIIVDELCTNAIRYGSRDSTSRIEVKLTWSDDHIDLSVIDEGGSEENISSLRKIIDSPKPKNVDTIPHSNLGLEIVKMLSENIEVSVDEDNITSVHIVRNREDA